MKKIFKWYLLEEEDIKNIISRGNKHEARLQRLEKRGNNIENLLSAEQKLVCVDAIRQPITNKKVEETAVLKDNTHYPMWAKEVIGTRELSLEEWQEINRAIRDGAESVTTTEIIRCKNCKHNNNCEIQYAAQAGSEFFCGAAEIESEDE